MNRIFPISRPYSNVIMASIQPVSGCGKINKIINKIFEYFKWIFTGGWLSFFRIAPTQNQSQPQVRPFNPVITYQRGEEEQLFDEFCSKLKEFRIEAYEASDTHKSIKELVGEFNTNLKQVRDTEASPLNPHFPKILQKDICRFERKGVPIQLGANGAFTPLLSKNTPIQSPEHCKQMLKEAEKNLLQQLGSKNKKWLFPVGFLLSQWGLRRAGLVNCTDQLFFDISNLKSSKFLTAPHKSDPLHKQAYRINKKGYTIQNIEFFYSSTLRFSQGKRVATLKVYGKLILTCNKDSDWNLSTEKMFKEYIFS